MTQINNNPPSFKMALHVDLREVEETAGKRVLYSLKNKAIPRLRELAKDVDIYIKGTRYPNNYFVDETGIKIRVKNPKKYKNFFRKIFNIGITAHVPNEGKQDFGQLIIDVAEELRKKVL